MRQSKPKTNKCQFSIQIQVPQNEFQSQTFENLEVDNQMMGGCG